MPPIIIECAQGTGDWFEARRGVPTASNFDAVMSKREGRRTYLFKLAADAVFGLGDAGKSFTNEHTERGHRLEPEVRRYYEFMSGLNTSQVGFVRNGRVGCSPDALVGENGLLEIKTHMPHILSQMLLDDKFPSVHTAQVQGQLLVTEREWCDLCGYWPGMPSMIRRAYRDDEYLAQLDAALDSFIAELDDVIGRLEGLRDSGAYQEGGG